MKLQQFDSQMTSITNQSQTKSLKIIHHHHHNQPISSQCTTIVYFTCTLLLCFVIAINALYQTPLFILGINFIYEYQKHVPYNFLHVIQNIFSFLCNPRGIGAVLIVYYIVVNRKLLLLVHLSYFFMANYILSLLKQSFQQSRPIWVNQQIQKWQWFCPTDFGNPSGHSFAVIMLYQPIISDSIGYGKHKFWAITLFVFCIMVPLSRMYLGVHSANQILFGLVLGQIFLILYKYIYQRYIYYLFWSVLMKHQKKKKLIIAIIIHILAAIIPIIFFKINVKTRPVPQKYIQNLNRICSKSLTGLQVQGHMLTACVHYSMFFGIVYGFLLLMDTPNYRKYLLGLWEFQSCKNVLLKIIISLFCSLLPMAIFKIIGQYVGNKEPIIQYILFSIGSLLFGLGLSYFTPVLTGKCKIMKFLPGPAKNYQDRFEQLN